MALVLRQVRRCDGQCCRESPRFPNADGTDCIHHLTSSDGKENAGCELMNNPAKRPNPGVKSVLVGWESLKAVDVFQDTCVDWPHNTPVIHQKIGDTGGCCWQWEEV